MKINLAKSAGFCFGVKRAIDIAFKAAASRKNVYMLGDIVHNEEVVKGLEKSGIKKASRLSGEKNRTFLIRAHGTDQGTLKKARRLGYRVIDATCPMVKEIHHIVRRMEKQGYRIIVIGDRRHDEVRGIVGQLKSRAIIIDSPKHIPLDKIKNLKKVCIVAQSTQNLENVSGIVKRLKQYIKDLEFFNTVCNPTRLKQAEIKKMPLQNQVMIIIGSKNSANTKRLYQISRSLNKRSYWVSSKLDLRREWFRGIKSTGVTAGASTPDYTTQEVIGCIRQLG